METTAMIDAWKAQLYKGLAELALLALLQNRARYGLELLAALRDEAGMEVSEGSIYPLLHRIEKAGHVATDWRLDPDATHPRKYYSLTPAGQTALEAMRGGWRELSLRLDRLMEQR